MYAGKHENFIVKALSAPGLWVQRLTTKEPTPDMVEVAICSTKCALRDEYPEFNEYFVGKEWEKKNCDSSSAEEPEDAEGSISDAEEPKSDAVENTENASESLADTDNAEVNE